MLALEIIEASPQSDGGTQIVVSLISAAVLIITAVLSFLGVKAGRTAKVAAEQTQAANSSDHGRVAQRLDRLTEVSEQLAALVAEVKDDLTHMDSRLHDLGRRQVTITDQLVIHQQWHLDHPAREQNP